MPHVRLKLIMRWCVQNLSTFNDGTNYRPNSMISNLTEIIMCLHEETGDSTHERTGRGSWGQPLPRPPPFPSQILGNSDFFEQQEKFWQNHFYKSFHVSFRLFFSLKAIFFYLKLYIHILISYVGLC